MYYNHYQDLKTIGKTRFHCIQNPSDQSVYYGDVLWYNKTTDEYFTSLDQVPSEEAKKGVKMVRNGYGIQLFGRNPENNVLVYYAGEWQYDKKSGVGEYQYADGSKYQGYFNDDKYSSQGNLSIKVEGGAPDAFHNYSGYFDKGKMTGYGQFKSWFDSQVFEGQFCNDLFKGYADDYYKNPFLKKEEVDKFDQDRLKFKKMEEQKKKEEAERVHLFRINSEEEFNNAIQQTRDSNRTSLIIASVEQTINLTLNSNRSHRDINHITSFMRNRVQNVHGNSLDELSLIEYELFYQEFAHNKKNECMVRETISKIIRLQERYRDKFKAIIFGGNSLILHFDQDPNQPKAWKEMYDPDIDHMINPNCLPKEIWTPNALQDIELMKKLDIVQQKEDSEQMQREFEALELKKFEFYVWSKYRVKAELSDEEILKAVKKRFGKSLPLQYCNLLLVQTQDIQSY